MLNSAHRQQKRELMERLLQKLSAGAPPDGAPAFATSAERPFTRECVYDTGERPSLTMAVHNNDVAQYVLRYLGHLLPEVEHYTLGHPLSHEKDPPLVPGLGTYRCTTPAGQLVCTHSCVLQPLPSLAAAPTMYTWLTLWADSDAALRQFVKDAETHAKPRTEAAEYLTYILKEGAWAVLAKRRHRPPSSLHLPGTTVHDLIEDAEAFRSGAEEYASLGVPHKRNYLFHGPPGTGKTSLVSVLASALGMDVALLSPQRELADPQLMASLGRLPANCLLVLEDVDAFTGDAGPSLSALLNVLDGMAHRAGGITVLTTNHRRQLDPAVLRPGRIDRHLEFRPIQRPEVQSMVRAFLPSLAAPAQRELATRCAGSLAAAALQKFLLACRAAGWADPAQHLDQLDDTLDTPTSQLYG
jgi:hypothetical protein